MWGWGGGGAIAVFIDTTTPYSDTIEAPHLTKDPDIEHRGYKGDNYPQSITISWLDWQVEVIIG